jgi:hypothetical protein
LFGFAIEGYEPFDIAQGQSDRLRAVGGRIGSPSESAFEIQGSYFLELAAFVEVQEVPGGAR